MENKGLNVNAVLVEKTSSKSGKNYICIEIKLTDTYTKQVFLEPAELELLKLSLSKKQ